MLDFRKCVGQKNDPYHALKNFKSDHLAWQSLLMISQAALKGID